MISPYSRAGAPSDASWHSRESANMVLHCLVWTLALGLAAAGLSLRGTPENLHIFHLLNNATPAWAAAASWGSVLGLGAVPLLVVAAAGPRRATATAAVLLALLACGGLVQLLKYAVEEARPLATLGAASMHVVGAPLRGRSMPSGHAAAGACAATMLWCAASVHRRLITGALLLSLLAIFDACSRVIVGAHWPSDVLAGAGLGMASGWVVYGPRSARRLCERLGGWLQRPVGAGLLAMGLVLAAGSLWHGRGDYPQAYWLYLAFLLLGIGAAMRWLSQVPVRAKAKAGRDSDAALGAP